MTARLATVADAAALADIHGQAFDPPWRTPDLLALLQQPEVFGLVGPQSFILMRVVAGEAEVLTLAVAPPARRQGLARMLLATALDRAGRDGAQAVFLEVADDNPVALALYWSAGFEQVGRRRGYYGRAEAAGVDALVLRRDLNSPRA